MNESLILERERAIREEQLSAAFDTIGLRFKELSPLLRDRLDLSFATQKTLDDDLICARIATHLEEYQHPESTLTREDWQTVRQASIFTDIGKTGPREASKNELELISRLYAIDTILPGGPARHTLAAFLLLEPSLAARQEEHVETLTKMGLSGSMDMRTFFNEHAKWTYDLVKDDPALTQEVKISSALHHLLEGVIPEHIAQFDGERYLIPSLRKEVGERELWVMILDKYQAAVRRGHKTHEQAIAYLYTFAEKWVALEPYPTALRKMIEKCTGELDLTMQAMPNAVEEVAGTPLAKAA